MNETIKSRDLSLWEFQNFLIAEVLTLPPQEREKKLQQFPITFPDGTIGYPTAVLFKDRRFLSLLLPLEQMDWSRHIGTKNPELARSQYYFSPYPLLRSIDPDDEIEEIAAYKPVKSSATTDTVDAVKQGVSDIVV